ncbi:hypothetical protein B0H14DRAFT_3494594 [Mycena olivaceomarginata]|nr:hypothetical protein B0H14DRAFT_3494594 [Mycena olivaceomarginata]
MASFDAPVLSSAKEASVRTLHKSVCATQYEDPVDQDAFLVTSAHSILVFQPQVASFAMSSDISECVFAIRAKMLQNNIRLSTPPNASFGLLTDFTGKRKHAQDTHSSGAKAAADRAERRHALRHAAGEPSASSNSDAISVPSNDEDTPTGRQPSPIITNTNTLPTPILSPIHVRLIASLSPLTAIEALLIFLALSSPILPSPISPNPSLPDLVPLSPPSIIFLRKDPYPTEGKMTARPRGHATTRAPPSGNHLAPNTRVANCSFIPTLPVRTEFQIRQRLETLQAEIHCLSCTQKQLNWELQSLQEGSKPQVCSSED